MDPVARFIEKKKERLAQIASEKEELNQRLEVLSQEEAKVRNHIETAQEMAGELAGEFAVVKPSEAKNNKPRKKKAERKATRPMGTTLIEAIRRAISTLPAPFTTGDVKALLRREFPELVAQSHFASIAGTMRRMAVNGQLVAVEKGGPGKEASYSLPNDDSKPHPEQRVDHQKTMFEGERERVDAAR